MQKPIPQSHTKLLQSREKIQQQFARAEKKTAPKNIKPDIVRLSGQKSSSDPYYHRRIYTDRNGKREMAYEHPFSRGT